MNDLHTIEPVSREELLDGFQDFTEALKELGNFELPKAPDVIVNPPNINVAAPQVEVKPNINVSVPKNKPCSYRVHDIQRDNNGLLVEFTISAVE